MPPVGLSPCADVTPAAWLTDGARPWDELVGFGAAGFPAYARLRFIPDPTHPGQDEVDGARGTERPPELEQLRTAADALSRYTTTSDHLYTCLWEGWGLAGYDGSDPTAGNYLSLPHRGYYLFVGTRADLGAWPPSRTTRPRPSPLTPAFIWPEDHAWCIASDIDPHWAGVGAAAGAVDALLAHPALDVVTADPRDDQPRYGA